MKRYVVALTAAVFAFNCIPAFAQSSPPPAGDDRAQPRAERSAKKVAKKTKKKARKAKRKAKEAAG